MTGSSKHKNPQYAGLLLSLILVITLCGGIWFGYGHTHNDERRKAAAQAQYDHFMQCSARFSNPSLCRVTAEQARYSQSIEYYDLKAQQDMAKLSAVMLLVTGVGVVLVGVTVWQTRGVLAEAKSTTDAAVQTLNSDRAWILEDQVKWARTEPSDAEPGYLLSVRWRNYGRSPATELFVSSRISVNTELLDEQLTFFPEVPDLESCPTTALGPGQHVDSADLYLSDGDIALLDAGRVRAFIRSSANYKTLRTTNAHRSEVWREIKVNGRQTSSAGTHPNFIFLGIPGKAAFIN